LLPQALGDIAVAHSVKEVDRHLAAELAGGLLPGLDPELQQKPLLDMLLDLLHLWTEDFAAAVAAGGAKKKKAGRRSRGGEDLEQLGALGAAVVESLARLVRCHMRWQAKEGHEGQYTVEDVEVVRVSHCTALQGGACWQSVGAWRMVGPAAWTLPQVLHGS
jgi:hypothetical protein